MSTQHSRPVRFAPVLSFLSASALFAVACGGSTKSTGTAPSFDAAASGGDAQEPDAQAPSSDGALDSADSAAPTQDSAAPARDTGTTVIGVDGAAATRNASCTPTSQQSGTAVNSPHGRLDGTLVYVVGQGQGRQCNGDDSHVHLQIQVSGEVYDVAVDIGKTPNDEIGIYQTGMSLPGGEWSEGWHDDNLSYRSLGLSSSNFPIIDPGTAASQIEAALANTSQISVFCTGYSQGNGCHDVHYENGASTDGAIVLDPSAATPQILFVRFQSDSF
jgi:hypothetical protein